MENKNRGTIKVLGTVFNAKIDKGSDKIITTLIEGCVSFEGSGQKIKLYPNQQAAFDYTTGNIDVHEVDIEKEISWKEGLIKYKMIMSSHNIDGCVLFLDRVSPCNSDWLESAL